jgi:hypothetical protein
LFLRNVWGSPPKIIYPLIGFLNDRIEFAFSRGQTRAREAQASDMAPSAGAPESALGTPGQDTRTEASAAAPIFALQRGMRSCVGREFRIESAVQLIRSGA